LRPTRWGAYNLGCFWSLVGNPGRAVDALRRALELGFADALITSDPDLDPLRGVPEFDALVAESERRLRSRQELARSVFPWQD